MEQTIVKLRGEMGSRIELSLEREGEARPLKLTMNRAAVKIATVRQREVAPGMAYLRISQFQDATPGDFVRQANALTQLADPAPRGLLLDLRGNPGGLLDSTVRLCGLFVSDPAAPVVVLAKRGGAEPLGPRGLGLASASEVLTPAARRWLQSVPVVVLVDRRTASGAEALAQFLREQAGARLVGSRTGGVASVRTHLVLAGESALNLVTGELHSPGGVHWEGTGLTPDEVLADAGVRGEYGDAADAALPPALKALEGQPPRVVHPRTTGGASSR